MAASKKCVPKCRSVSSIVAAALNTGMTRINMKAVINHAHTNSGIFISAMPGATNVIPGLVSFTLDIRAPTDRHRKLAVADIVRRIETIAKRRELALQIDVTHENRTVPCAPWLKAQVAEAVAAEGYGVFELPSGAGHDGMAMIDVADVAMLFVRCRGGISHNPAEHVETADADAGARVLLRLIENFRPKDQCR